MPASEAQDVRRARLLQGFFWGGVGLATLAMLVLLFSQSVMVLRVAVILCVVAIMMLAISIVLRPSIEMVRVDIEEHIVGEVERVRLRARDDISTAARNTHRVLSEKIHALTATVEALRVQIEELKVNAMLGGGGAGPHLGPAAAAAGVVHRTETVQVTRRTTTVDPGEDTRGTVYGSRSAVDGEWSEGGGEDRGTRPRTADEWSAPRPAEGGYGEADWEATFRSLSRRQNALPPSPGRSASWYTDDEPSRSRGRDRESRYDHERDARDGGRGRHGFADGEPDHDRYDDRYDDRHDDRHEGRHSDRYSDRRRDREWDRERRHDRGRDREWEREWDRERYRDHDDHRDDHHRDDRYRDDRYRDGRYRDRGPDRYEDRGRHERSYEREFDDDRERGYGRDREYDRGHARDRGYHGEPYGRGYEPDPHLPRPRSPHPSERER